MKKFALILALIVSFVCGMYFQVAIDYSHQLAYEYRLDLFEGAQR